MPAESQKDINVDGFTTFQLLADGSMKFRSHYKKRFLLEKRAPKRIKICKSMSISGSLDVLKKTGLNDLFFLEGSVKYFNVQENNCH